MLCARIGPKRNKVESSSINHQQPNIQKRRNRIKQSNQFFKMVLVKVVEPCLWTSLVIYLVILFETIHYASVKQAQLNLTSRKSPTLISNKTDWVSAKQPSQSVPRLKVGVLSRPSLSEHHILRLRAVENRIGMALQVNSTYERVT